MGAAAAVNPEKVLRELRELWAQMAQDQADSGGVLRACAMTLVATASDAADAGRVREAVGALMHSHPSRAIIVCETASDGAKEMDAHVFAECWKPFGSNQQLCSEGIEITPGDGGMGEVVRFLVPLRAPDLPLVLWRRRGLGRDTRHGGQQGYDALWSLADKIVFDTRDAPDATGALAYLRGLQSQGRRVGDLNWTRLTGWREEIGHLFDDRAVEPEAVVAATVAYGGGRLSTAALYMAAWIRSALPSPDGTVPVALEAESAPGPEPAGLIGVEFETADEKLSIRRAEGDCVAVTGAGRNYHSSLPPARVEDLMREELGILGRDPVFERVLAA